MLFLFCVGGVFSQDSLYVGVTPNDSSVSFTPGVEFVGVAEGTDIQVKASTFWQWEPHLFTSEMSWPNLFIGSYTKYGGSNFLGGYFSTNGGSSWQGNDQMPVYSSFPNSPTVAFDNNLKAYFSYDRYHIIDHYGYDDASLISSTNLGSSWTYPLDISDQDYFVYRPWMSIDEHMDVPQGIYVAYTDRRSSYFGPDRIMFQYSIDDEGQPYFYPPVEISGDATGEEGALGVSTALGPNGEIYAVWAMYDPLESEPYFQETGIGFNKSYNSGSEWESAEKIADIQGIYNLWEHKNPANPPLPITVVSYPSIAVDSRNNESPWYGTIYVVYAALGANGDKSDIMLIKSSDEGESWSSPVKVNSDNTTRDQWNPAVTVNQYGLVSVVFFDSRNSSTNQSVEAWMAHSTDGGTTFFNSRVSDRSFVPYPVKGSFFGNRLGIACAEETVVPCWYSSISGYSNYQLFVDPIDVTQLDWAILAAPANLQHTLNGQSNPVFTWTASPEGSSVTGYKIYRNGGVLATLNGRTTTTFTDYDIAVGSGPTYSYVVKGFNSAQYLTRATNADVINGNMMKTGTSELTFSLGSYPNPFNPSTSIAFELPEDEKVTLAVYDALGREVAKLVDNELRPAGMHRITFDGSRLASGVYFCRIEAGTFTRVRKLLLIK